MPASNNKKRVYGKQDYSDEVRAHLKSRTYQKWLKANKKNAASDKLKKEWLKNCLEQGWLPSIENQPDLMQYLATKKMSVSGIGSYHGYYGTTTMHFDAISSKGLNTPEMGPTANEENMTSEDKATLQESGGIGYTTDFTVAYSAAKDAQNRVNNSLPVVFRWDLPLDAKHCQAAYSKVIPPEQLYFSLKGHKKQAVWYSVQHYTLEKNRFGQLQVKPKEPCQKTGILTKCQNELKRFGLFHAANLVDENKENQQPENTDTPNPTQ